MVTQSKSCSKVLFASLCVLALHVERIIGQQTSPNPESTASVNECPVLIITPSLQYPDYGQKAQFTGVIEAKLEYPTDGRWQKLRNGFGWENLHLDDEKYSGSGALSPCRLVINNADFDDEGEYRLQVRISGRWCSNSTVRVPKVQGILQYNARCSQTRECDERKNLRCSDTQTCLCDTNYYPYNQNCYSKSSLSVSIRSSSITASMIRFEWTPPSHSDLIHDYTISIRHNNGTTITSTHVGKQTSYNYAYDFVPGYRYYFRITSNVRIPNPSEQFSEATQQAIVVVPLSPGPINRHDSIFHPEKLHLKWAKPPNNTRVDYYSITISDGYSSYSPSLLSSNELVTSHRFKPGTNHTVTITSRSYGVYSQQHREEFQTLRTPLLSLTPNGWPNVPYLSDLVIKCTVINNTDFPPTLETKWSRNDKDINITDSMYTGSSVDLFTPQLVINRIDFDRDDDDVYRCSARNSEGWGTSERTIRIDVKGSIKFQQQCNRSMECLYGARLTCSLHQCLCYSSYYHKDKVCYPLSNLVARSIVVRSSKCDISMNWGHPNRDADLISGYEVFLEEYRSGWRSLDKVFVGNTTYYTTPCKLESGRLHRIRIRSKISLRDPIQEMFVDSSYTEIVLEPRKPGQIINSLSNFSADGVHLVWEESDAFVNRYRVVIDGHQQNTLDSKPEIYWKQLLLPITQYNVTITAISYGYITNYPSYGSRESQLTTDWFMTSETQYSGKAYMSYGEEDIIMAGDKVTSKELKSPTTVYVGDGSNGGFNYVVIGSNGIIGLGENFNGESIYAMDSKFVKERQILCPFWADLASTDDVGKVYYNTYRRGKEGEHVDGMFMEKADSIVKQYFRDFSDFKATWLVKVTWENMTLYGHKDKKVTFQCFLITDGENTFAVINYMDINLAPIKNFNISIGYRYKNLYVKNSFTKQSGAFKMSIVPGNQGERGFWIYKMTEGVKAKKEEKLCFFWYSHNIEKQVHHSLSNVLDEIQCPCDHRLLRFDPRYAINRFDKSNRILCYASMTVGSNVECCYDMYANVDDLGPLRRSVPLAGTVLQYNPFFQRYQYTNYDLNPRKQCCSSGHCAWYYEVRPIPRCYWRSPFQPGINFGDPHITTLDGLDYTFNGFGEYTMLNINTSTASFTLQARTELASSANGTTINATVFTAFVAQDHTGSKVQIEMSRNKKEMIIKGNGLDLTNRFKNSSYIFLKQNLTMSWQNQSITATFLKTSNTIKISLGKRFLICETLINEKYKGLTTGLMGNFDGNKSNDFILPNGTLLHENATDTERKIYYNFGQLWSVNNASLFQYDDELSFENFSHPDFIPMFTDEVDKGRLNEAKQKCGSNSSKACISDYLATGDITLAEVSGKKEQDSKSEIKIIENETPVITGNTTLFVEVNKEVEIKFNVSDDGQEKPHITFLKQPENFHLDDEANLARWLPQKHSIPEISIVAIDGHGAQSPSLDYQIVLCEGCGEHGDCDFENLMNTDHDRFQKAVCNCHVGYSGDQCSQNTDGCLHSPCPLDRKCTDLTPEEEEKLGREYNCSECPAGYTEVNNKCQDIDECASNANSCDKAKETCENTDGGYVCNCMDGYRKLQDQCNEIDECMEKSSGCEQICQNTPGSFQCSCVPGFTLNKDNTTCSKTDDDLCKNFDKKCEYACSKINGVTQCFCPSGYVLTENGINCTDVDECKLETTPCDQDCINLNGTFQCSCRPGYSLSADKTTCSRCELPNYGVNCSQVCECGPGVDRCDFVSGCVCQSGWTGQKCDKDIDECQENPLICGNTMICNNTEGSYRCTCQTGFELVDGNCEDIDECGDESLNDCPRETTTCVNTYGKYNCDCQQGYQTTNGSGCQDIDECTMNNHKCSQMCKNTPGSYNCLCFFGFVLTDDRTGCEEVKDSCTLYPDLNCTYGCRRINEHKGVCFCESGFEVQEDGTCKDINECLTSPPCEHNCTNKIGSFECSCAIGHRLGNDGRSCTECNQDFYGENCELPCTCGRGSKECNHITGCVCDDGWEGDTCKEDINECQNNPCTGEHEVCLNTPGSYRCDCATGYRNNSGICEEIDECQDPHTCHQLCFNTNGSYTCACKNGFELINSRDCIDINECESSSRCQQCSNWPGGFKCSCGEGYRLNSTKLNVCDNIDECEENTNNCSANASCIDTDGGFNCNCHVGLEGSGYNCTVCTAFRFGEQCSEDCKCNKTNSEYCDAVTGTCHCKTGWTGSECTQDLNECENNAKICDSYQTCVNTVGSYNCKCLYGGVDITNCTRPLSPIPLNETIVKVKAEIRFNLNIDREIFLTESKSLRIEFQNKLRTLHNAVSGFSTLVVLSIRYGSIFIDYESVGNKIEGKNSFEKDVATVLTKMLNGERKLDISNYGPLNVTELSIKDSNGTIKTTFKTAGVGVPCQILKLLGGCSTGYYCDDSSTKAECIKEKTDFSVIAIITISAGVGLPLLITIVVLVILWKRFQKRALKLKQKSLTEDKTDFFGKSPRATHTNEYDYIPSDAMSSHVYSEMGCSNPEYNWDTLSEKLQKHQEFRIQRPTVNRSKPDKYMY